MSEEENVLGGFEANARLDFGSERLLVFLTQRRLIMAHKAKLGRVRLTLSSLLGRMAEGVESIGKGGQDLAKMTGVQPGTILRMNRENFAIDYDDIVSFNAEPGDQNVSTIILVGKDRKVEMSVSSIALNGLWDLIQELFGEKAFLRTS